MNISRFFGSTNREALRQVRLALGPDALIVSNRRINGGVEILATDPTSVPPDGDQAAAPPHTPAPAAVDHRSVPPPDRKSVVEGKGVVVRFGVGGGRIIKKK